MQLKSKNNIIIKKTFLLLIQRREAAFLFSITYIDNVSRKAAANPHSFKVLIKFCRALAISCVDGGGDFLGKNMRIFKRESPGSHRQGMRRGNIKRKSNPNT